jgi:hypothetical protein
MFSSDALPLERRALLRGAILLVGGSLAGISGEVLAQATAKSARFFNAARFATLAEVADIMIPRTATPGAKDAGVPEAMDALMVNWASKERQQQFRSILDEINARAKAAGASSLVALPMAKRVEVVRAYDADKFGAKDWPYNRFKELVMTLYYLSEPGATKELRYELIPGKWEPGIELKSDTPAWAA